ncbi:MAG: hypothetical protein QOI10_966 [Solirubrobacterales bacterium]|nr:hypothetical protein [Solirubrobacterales bacterium]
MSEAANDPGPGRLTRLLPLAVLAAAICLFASELLTLFEFTPPGGEAQCALDNGDRHSNAQMVIAGFAVIGTLVAVYGGSRPAAISVAVMGILALLIFLIADLRFANTVGTLGDACNPNTSLIDAKTVPQGGFYLELVGALTLAVTGIALATLTPEQLRALRPSRRARPTEERGGDGPAAGSSAPRGDGAKGGKGTLSRLGRRPRARPRG